MSGLQGKDIADVISGVKKAVMAAQLRDDTNVDIEKMELTLKGFIETSGSIGFNFKIPFVDVNIGPSCRNQVPDCPND